MTRAGIFHIVTMTEVGLMFPLVIALVPYYEMSLGNTLVSILFFVGLGYLLNYALLLAAHEIARKTKQYKAYVLSAMRIAITILLTGIFVILFLGSWQLMVWERINLAPLFDTALLYTSVNILAAVCYEAIVIARKKRFVENQLYVTSAPNQEEQLQSLHSELNPHFLFNSITILDHLVSEDLKGAEVFTKKLAAVYKRFHLHHPNRLIPLGEELLLLQDYCYLLNIRFGESIVINNQLPAGLHDCLILPATLQLLVENCVKHTCFSETDPLLISISVKKNYIVIANSYRPKQPAISTTRIGLQNLTTRYDLLLGRKLKLTIQKQQFVVCVPLISKKQLHDPNSHYRR